MVKQNKIKKQLRNEAEWQDIKIKKSTIKCLKQLQLDFSMRKYDDVIQCLLNKEGSQ